MIDALPSLNRTDATFKTDVDTFFGTELPAFSVQAEAARVQINSNTTTAQQQADLAQAQVPLAQAQTLIATQQAQAAASSALSAGAIVWVTGTTYAIGNLRYSPLNSQVYRRLTAGAGTTDPSLDATNWIIVNGITSENINVPSNNLPLLRPTLNLDFSNNQSVDPRITFTRASIATRVNAKGLIELVPSGVPRIDFDAVTGACKGLLIEEQRVNLLTYSEQFDDAAWTKTRATVMANATTAPDGLITADKLVEDTTASNSHQITKTGVAASALTTYTNSFYMKADGRTRAQLQLFGNSGGSTVDIDLNAVTANATGAYGGWASASAAIASVGNGWFRVTHTATTNSGLASVTSLVLLRDNLGAFSYTGDGTSGLFIWGAQLEAGAFPTSYIPTVASQVTRAADVATMTGANFSSWYRQDEGSLLANFSTPLDYATGFNTVFAISDGTSNNRIVAVCNSAGNVINIETTASGVVSSGFYPAYLSGASSIALAIKSNDANYAKDGVAGTADTSVVVPVVSQMNIGTINGGGSQLNGHLRSVSFYPKRLTNAELQALSTQ